MIIGTDDDRKVLQTKCPIGGVSLFHSISRYRSPRYLIVGVEYSTVPVYVHFATTRTRPVLNKQYNSQYVQTCTEIIFFVLKMKFNITLLKKKL